MDMVRAIKNPLTTDGKIIGNTTRKTPDTVCSKITCRFIHTHIHLLEFRQDAQDHIWNIECHMCQQDADITQTCKSENQSISAIPVTISAFNIRMVFLFQVSGNNSVFSIASMPMAANRPMPVAMAAEAKPIVSVFCNAATTSLLCNKNLIPFQYKSAPDNLGSGCIKGENHQHCNRNVQTQ